MESIYIVMPAYNEEQNIESVVKQWYPILSGKSERSRLIIADSGSSDTTHVLLTNLQKNYPQLIVLSDTLKYHGPKCIALYDLAIKNGIDYVFQTDSDGQTNPEEFNEFWNLREDFDGIFGNRTHRGDGKNRAFVEKVLCFSIRIIFGTQLPDANAPFRLMKCETLKKYLYKMPYDYNLPNVMLTTYFAYYGEKLEFKEISFKPRQAGKNTINIHKIIKIGWNALGQFRKLKKEM